MALCYHVLHCCTSRSEFYWQGGFADMVGIILWEGVTVVAKGAHPEFRAEIDLGIWVENWSAFAWQGRVLDQHKIFNFLDGTVKYSSWYNGSRSLQFWGREVVPRHPDSISSLGFIEIDRLCDRLHFRIFIFLVYWHVIFIWNKKRKDKWINHSIRIHHCYVNKIGYRCINRSSMTETSRILGILVPPYNLRMYDNHYDGEVHPTPWIALGIFKPE